MARHINVHSRAEAALRNMSISQALMLCGLVSDMTNDRIFARISALESDLSDLKVRNVELAVVNQDLARRLAEANAAVGAERLMKARLETEIADLRARLAHGEMGVGDEVDGKDGTAAIAEESQAVTLLESPLLESDAQDSATVADAGDLAEQACPVSAGPGPDPERAERQDEVSSVDALAWDLEEADNAGRGGEDAGESRAARRLLIEGALETRSDLLAVAQSEHASLTQVGARLEHDLREAAAELEAERQERISLEEMAAALRKTLKSGEEITVAA